MSNLTPDQRERFVCCVKPRLCKDDHYHERDVARMLADERERIAHAIDVERYTDRWGDDAVRFGLSIAARIARETAPACMCPTDAEIRAAIHHSHQQLTGGNQ